MFLMQRAHGSHFEKYWSRKWREESLMSCGESFPMLDVSLDSFLENPFWLAALGYFSLA